VGRVARASTDAGFFESHDANLAPKPRKSLRKVLLVPAIVLLIIVASVGGFYIYQQLSPSASCANPLGGAKVLRTQLAPPTTIGGVTEFALPQPLRAPNGITVAPDGSVWFGEQSVAGVAHFYPGNRTLVEYAWPFNYKAPPSTAGFCGNKSDIFGVTLWDGKVWVGDTSGNQLVGLDPSTGQFSTVKIPTNTSYPYTMTPGPNDTLWIAELFAGQIGELSANGTVRQFSLPGGTNAEPAQIVFANSTTGFIDDVGASQSGGGGIYSFNVNHFAPVLVGGQRLFDPSSIALASGALWVALHGSSSVGSYNFTTKSWSYLPTSTVLWDGSPATTLPYFVNANGSEVWANEHYGNRIAMIDPANGSLAEYSESNHPVDGTTITGAETFAVGGGRAWFTEWFSNGLGYVDSDYDPGFYTSIAGNNTLTLASGSSASVNLVVHDTTHQGSLNVTFADSESFISKPTNLTFSVPSTSISPPVGGESTVIVTIAASHSLKPGTYWAILTATDGLTFESSFLKVVVPS
jgi:streptogramin lyase